MSLQVEKLEKNMAKLTVEVPAEQFEAALKTSYNKNKNKFNIPGFRKGKAPQAMIEKMYGVGVFYEDAVDEAINASYPDAAKESGLEIVSRPEISIEQVEKGKSFIYVATVATKPEVTLGEYKGIEVEKAKPEVTDADVEAELKKVQENHSAQREKLQTVSWLRMTISLSQIRSQNIPRLWSAWMVRLLKSVPHPISLSTRWILT